MQKKILVLVAILFCTLKAYGIEDVKKEITDCGCEHHHHSEKAVEVKDGSVLNIRDCIAIGMEHSSIIKEAAYRLEIARSEVGIAKSAYFPELGVGVGYRQEFNSNRYDFLRNYRELPTVGVALNKMIWDFGRTTANIKMADFLRIAAEYEFEDTVCSTVFDIKAHYYGLLKAKADFEAQKLEHNLQTNLVKEIQKLVKSGKKNNADLLYAQVELLKIKSELKKAENEYKNAKERLNNSMFLVNAPNYTIYETQSFTYNPAAQTAIKNISNVHSGKISKDDTVFQYPKLTYKQAVDIAYKNSPDIKALIATRDSFEQALLMVKRSYYPELKAGVGYDLINTNLYNNNGLSVAVTIDSSINAMRQKYDLKGAHAQLDLADTEIKTFKENLYFTVREALNNVETTYENLPIYKNQMNKSSENFKQTYDNYFSDKMNQLELESAREVYINSVKDYINSLYDYNISLIELEMSMHEHLIDYHDDAEHAADYHEGNENETLSRLIRCNKKHKH